MTIYKPFRTYEGIETRKIKDRKMAWASFETKTYGDYLMRTIKEDKEEFKKVANLFRKSFPELYGGLYDFLLYPDQYPLILGEGEEFLKGEWYITVTEHKNNIVAAGLYRMFPRNMAIEWSVGATDPTYREKGMQKFRMKVMDEFIERCGVEYAYGFCATYHKASQENLLSLGFKVVGVIPGFIAGWMDGDSYYRMPVVWMQKFYNRAEKMIPNDEEWIMIPEAKRLWDIISSF